MRELEEDPIEPMEPSPELRERVLAFAHGATRFEGFVQRVGRLFDLPEEDARRLLAASDPTVTPDWVVDGFGEGIHLYHLQGGEAVADADCGLVSVSPGRGVPRHRHVGVELVLALAGSAEEDSGERWEPGDLVVREADSVHSFRAVSEEPFLFAVVLFGGLEGA